MKTSRTLAKIISIALVLCMMLSFVSCEMLDRIFGGSLELTSFVVDRSSVKTTYYIGEEIDFSGIRATVKYSDSSLNTELTFDDLTITYDEDITDTVGEKNVKVSFRDPHLEVEKYTLVAISVTEDPSIVKHESYKLDASAVKKNYDLGDTIDLTGLKLIEVMSDKTEVEVTDLTGLTFSVDLATVTATAGNVTVTATYNGEAVTGTIVFRVTDSEATNPVTDIVISGNYKTLYDVGDTVDLTGVVVTVTYKESGERTVTTGLTVGAVDMSTPGTKSVQVYFVDPIHGNEEYEYITITVIKRDVVMQFSAPDGLSAFKTANSAAGGSATGNFIKGGKTYVIGDDNEFKLNPTMKAKVNGVPTALISFYSVVDIYVDGVLLSKTTDNQINYTYSLNGEKLVTVDTFNGKYQFAKPLDNVQIIVLPSAGYYKYETTGESAVNPVILNAKVIDAYNVYTPEQLSVIDNYTGSNWGRDLDDNPDWASNNWTTLKKEWGLDGIDPAGIVLHNDIEITSAYVPSSFLYEYDGEIVYKNANGDTDDKNNVITKHFDGYYLKDHTVLYYHSGSSDFVIEGNFFTINAEKFPLVPSISIFGEDRYYGTDYSNSALFLFQTIDESWVADDDERLKGTDANGNDKISDVTINNLSLRGNAGRDGWVIEKAGTTVGNGTELVTAGGLIMLKSMRHANVTLDNVINNCFFISYFPDYQGNLTVNNSKCYDSYQNAAFVWADSTLTIDNSVINGTGGPVIIEQSVKEDNVYYNPVTIITNTKAETAVTGQEVWFTAVGATGVIPSILAISAKLNETIKNNYVLGQGETTAKGASLLNGDGKMNIIAALMNNADNAAQALQDAMVQGSVLTDGTGIDRWQTSADWISILTNSAFQSGAPFLTAYDKDGKAHTMMFAPTETNDYGLPTNGILCNLNQTPIGSSDAELVNAFANADELVLHWGGLSILFELSH